MRRFFVIDSDNTIAAEGVLFVSGMAAVSFCSGEPASGVAVWSDIESAEAIHERVGGRRIVWYDWTNDDTCGGGHDPCTSGAFEADTSATAKRGDPVIIEYKQHINKTWNLYKHPPSSWS
jgi:hypothetical protein